MTIEQLFEDLRKRGSGGLAIRLPDGIKACVEDRLVIFSIDQGKKIEPKPADSRAVFWSKTLGPWLAGGLVLGWLFQLAVARWLTW